VTILISLILLASIIVCIWVYKNKTFKSELAINEIVTLNQSRFNSSGFYLELNNKKQRNLTEIRDTDKAIELLEMLRAVNPIIVANFIEQKVNTR
jgi:hypothetical protein